METSDQVKQIAYELGYPQPHQLDRDFVLMLGVPPSTFRRWTAEGVERPRGALPEFR